jgi:hypothetical protein
VGRSTSATASDAACGACAWRARRTTRASSSARSVPGVLAPGARLPDVTVYAAPGEALKLSDAAAGSKTLFLFYLFDFSGT